MNDSTQFYLITLLSQIPTLLVFAAGATIALLQRHRHPQPSLFVLLGSVLLLVVSLLQPALTAFMTRRIADGSGNASVYTAMGVLGFFFSALRAGGFGLLVAAAFVRRNTAETPPGFRQ